MCRAGSERDGARDRSEPASSTNGAGEPRKRPRQITDLDMSRRVRKQREPSFDVSASRSRGQGERRHQRQRATRATAYDLLDYLGHDS